MTDNVLLLSTTNISIDGVTSVSTLDNANWGMIDCLIYHSCSDKKLDVLLNLPNICKQLDKVIYINKDIDPILFSLFKGIGADIYNDESYLEDSSILDFLVDNYNNTGMTVKDPNDDMLKVSKNISAIITATPEEIKKLANNPNWVKTLEDAICSVENALVVSNEVNTNVVEVLGASKQLVTVMQSNYDATAKELDTLKVLIDALESKAKPNTPFMYNSFNVQISTPRVLYLRCYGHCKGLMSFMRGYQHYLKMKNRSSRLLLAAPKLNLLMQRYKDVPRLALDSIGVMNLTNDFYVTFEPKKQILDAFFNQNVDFFIVVDMMFGREPLITGSRVCEYYPVTDPSDAKKFGLDSTKVISFDIAFSKGVKITKIKGYYSFDRASKLAALAECSMSTYDDITSVIDQKGRVY